MTPLAAIPIAFATGFAAGLNPCCLALFPAAAATCCAASGGERSSRLGLASALAFMLGSATTATALGITAAFLGRMATGWISGPWFRCLLALVPLLMGMQLLGWLRLPMPKVATPKRRGVVGAYASGLVLALAMGPCGTPALAAILAYAALVGSLPYAAALLVAYGLGNGVPMLLASAAASTATALLGRRGLGTAIQKGAGLVMVTVGFVFLWNAQ
jgi:cytochrome c biogenesis protein CcdA